MGFLARALYKSLRPSTARNSWIMSQRRCSSDSSPNLGKDRSEDSETVAPEKAWSKLAAMNRAKQAEWLQKRKDFEITRALESDEEGLFSKDEKYNIFVKERNAIVTATARALEEIFPSPYASVQNKTEELETGRAENLESVLSEQENAGEELWIDLIGDGENWLDNRLKKENSKSPDFEHKQTGVGLWLKDCSRFLIDFVPPPKS